MCLLFLDLHQQSTSSEAIITTTTTTTTTIMADIEAGDISKGALAFPEEQAPPVDAATSNQNGTTPKTKKILLLSLAALALMGLVVGLSVGLVQRNNKNAENDATTSTSSELFTQQKTYMDAVCSDINDTATCEQECQPVDCCNPFAEDTCIVENAQECYEYAKCHVLQQDSNAAPFDLADTCVMEDKDECRRICSENAKCCYDSTDNCQDSQFLLCLDYAPCQVLNTQATVPPAPSDLYDSCILSNDDAKCQEACVEASCCWDTTSEEGNCLATDLLTCMTYAPCGSLILQSPNNIVTKPTEAFQGDCSIDSVLTSEGYDACQEQCQDADCCWAEEGENCFQDDPVGCFQHLQCGLLSLVGGDVPVAETDELESKCNLQDVLSGGSFSDECKEACQAAECCISQDEEENCIVDGNALACVSYLSCLPVWILGDGALSDILTNGTLPDIFGDVDFSDFMGNDESPDDPSDTDTVTIGSPPDDLSTICSDTDLSECEAVCEEVSCCTSTGTDNCLLENIVACATWNLQGCFAVSGFQQSP